MRLSDKSLDEFRDIYQAEFREEISREEAAEITGRLFELARLLSRPLPETAHNPDTARD